MGKRFRPVTFLLLVLSVVLTSSAVALWMRARNTGRLDRLGFRLGQRPYAVRCDRGGVSLVGLPPAGRGDAAAEARALASRLRNEQARWLGSYSGVLRESGSQITCTVQRQTRVEGWSWVPAEACYGPLLEALEDPRRFVTAHHLLCEITQLPASVTARPEGEKSYVVNEHGMWVEFVVPRWDDSLDHVEDEQRRRQRREDWQRGLRDPKGIQFGRSDRYVIGGGQQVAKEATVAADQIPSLVRLWHDRLGVRYVTVPYWLVAAVGLVVPGRLAWRVGRTAWRRRRGRCLGCGYDLKASPDRCPECGWRVGDPGAAPAPEGAPAGDDAASARPSRARRRVAAVVGALLVLVLGTWAAFAATRRSAAREVVAAEDFAAQTRRDEQRLAELMGRIREVASSGAWRQRVSSKQRWRDPVIEGHVATILREVGQTAGRYDLALPVGFHEVGVSDEPARGPQSFDQDLYVVKGDVRGAGASKSIIVADGNVALSGAEQCLIVARGAVHVAHGKRNVIVAGHFVDVSHDGSTPPNAPTVHGSVLVSGSVLQVSHAHGSICRAPRLVRGSSARNATFVDSPAVEFFVEMGSKRFRRANFIVPADPKPNPLDGIIHVTSASWPYDDETRQSATAVLKSTGAPLMMKWNAPITTAAEKPVAELKGWKVSTIDVGYVLLTDGERDAEFFPPDKPH